MRTLLVLVLAAALVAGVWLLSNLDSAEGARTNSPDGPASGGDVPAAAQHGPAEPDLVAPREDGRAALQAERSPTEEVTQPAARVTGRLVDGLGRPVPDADLLLEEPSGRLRVLFGGSRPALGRARSGSDGRFAFDLAADATQKRLELTARLRGYAPLDRAVTTPSQGTIDLGELTLDRGAILAGRVVDPDGNPVPGAELMRVRPVGEGALVFGAPVGETLATTTSDGAFEIATQALGPWSLRTRHVEYLDTVAEGETHAGDDHQTGIEVVLRPGARIEGRLVGAPADELDEVTVEAWPVGDGEGNTATIRIEAGVSDPDSPGPRSTEVRPDGTFVLAGLLPDTRYRLQAARETTGLLPDTPVSDPVTARAPEQGVELRWGEPAVVELTVVDGRSGEPIENLSVRRGTAMLMPLFDGGFAPRSHFPEGRVRIDDLRPGAGGDRMSIEITAPGFASWSTKDVAIESGRRVDLGTVRLQPVPAVIVTVLDRGNGTPLAGALVELRIDVPERPGQREVSVRARVGGGAPEPPDHDAGPMPGELGAHRTHTDADGVARISSMPGERVRVVVTAASYAPTRSEPIELPRVGDHSLTLRMDEGAAAVVTALGRDGDPVPGMLVEHHSPIQTDLFLGGPDGGEKQYRTDLQGRARVPYLEPGRHHFRLQEEEQSFAGMSFRVHDSSGPAGEGWVAVDVAPGEDVEVELFVAARGALAGTVTEGGEPLAGARLVLRARDAMPLPDMPGMQVIDARTTSRGGYLFEGVKAGDYDLEVTHASRAMPASFPVEIEEGESDFDVDLPVCSVAGRILDSEGEPVAGARVRAKRKAPGGQRRMAMMVMASPGGGPGMVSISSGDLEGGESRTDEDGYYALRGLPVDVELVIEADAEDHAPASSEPFRLVPGEERELADVTLIPGGSLRVLVDSESYAVGLIAVASFAGEGNPEPKVAMLQEGVAVFEDLIAGPWSVRLSVMGPPSEDGPELPEPRTVEVEGGEEVLVDMR